MILPSVSDIPVLPFLDSSEDRDVAPATSGCTRGHVGPAARRISRPQVTAPEWLGTHFAKVCEKMEARLLALDGRDDHVHLLVEYPPRLSVSALINALKGTSSRLLRKERPDLADRYWKGVLWTPS
jgi:putative transposase